MAEVTRARKRPQPHMADEKEIIKEIARAIWYEGGLAEERDQCDLDVADIGDYDTLWKSARAVLDFIDLPALLDAAEALATYSCDCVGACDATSGKPDDSLAYCGDRARRALAALNHR